MIMRKLNEIYQVIMYKASLKPIILTKLIRDTHVDYTTMLKHLEYLISNDYIKEMVITMHGNKLPKYQYKRKYYVTTTKGKELLTGVNDNGKM
jgi:hypothetical protein